MNLKIIRDFLDKKFSVLRSAKEKDLQLILLIVIIVLAAVASGTLNFRFDLTRAGTYSLGDKSIELVSGLKEPMNVKVLFSENLPGEHETVSRYVRDLLEEYAYHSRGYFNYEIIEGRDLEREARDFGIQSVASQEYVDDQIRIRQTYMGLVFQHTDLTEKIDQITSAVGLEFQITSLIERMTGKIDRLMALEKPVQVKLFLDSRLSALPIKGMDKLSDTVREAVERAGKRNYNALEFSLEDSSQAAKATEKGQEYGLKRLKWRRSGNVPSGEALFGILIKLGEEFRVLDLEVMPTPFGFYSMAGLENLEDRISSAVDEMLSPCQKIGYITGHGEVDIYDNRSPGGGALFQEVLSDIYELVPIDLKQGPVPSDIELLVINGPKHNFSELELYRIDQHLLSGHSLLVFKDSYLEGQSGVSPGGRGMAAVRVKTNLDSMMEHYGIKVNDDIVLDQNCAQVSIGMRIQDYPLVPVIDIEGLGRKNPITGFLRGIAFIKSASLELTGHPDSELKIMPLVQSSSQSWTMKDQINFNPLFMRKAPEAETGSRTLAALASGRFNSYFKKPPVLSKKGILTENRHLSRTISGRTGNLLVAGTSEITTSGFILNSRKLLPNAGSNGVFANEIFLHSMADVLSGNEAIPEMKSKNLDYNPLKRTGNQFRFAIKSFNTAGVPFLVILAGFLAWHRRKMRQKDIEKIFQ